MKRDFHDHLRLLTITGVLTALTTVATLLIRIPTPTKGYVNLGDTIVNIAGWLLGPWYGAFAAGVGSALADLIAGYTVYIPATLVIKALMAIIGYFVFRTLAKDRPTIKARIASAIAAELVMIAGYALFEGVLYGSAAAALTSAAGNAVQGIFGAAASVLLYELVLRRIPRLTK